MKSWTRTFYSCAVQHRATGLWLVPTVVEFEVVWPAGFRVELVGTGAIGTETMWREAGNRVQWRGSYR